MLSRAVALAASGSLFFVPAIALACPGYTSGASGHAGAASCGNGSSVGSYLAAIGLGLAIGMGSSALEGIFQKKS
jgi:hypothetical protein